MRTSKKYASELKRQFGYLATWLPGTPISLGDIGIMRKNVFTKIANLSDFDIHFDVESDPSKSDIEHSTSGAVSISTKAAGTASLNNSALGETEAGIIVEFSKEKAILFKANGTSSPSIKNQIEVGKSVIDLYRQRKWDKDWMVVTEVVNAESATILISSSAQGKIELKAKGEIEAAKLDIADANIELELSYSKDLSTKIITEGALTPLFKASKVKNRLLNPTFKMNKLKSLDFEMLEKSQMDENYWSFEEIMFEDELIEEFY